VLSVGFLRGGHILAHSCLLSTCIVDLMTVIGF
jgi:hypothetical protein